MFARTPDAPGLPRTPRLRFPAPIAVPLIAAGFASAAAQASHAATLNVPVNHSLRLPVAGRAASVVVGNSQVADVTVVDSRTLFVTGKSAGSTDVAVVDPLGRTVFAADISVTAGSGRSVTVHRAGDTAELSCDPRCLAPSRDGSVASATTAQAAPIPGQAATNAGAMAGGMIGAAVGGSLGAAGGLPPLTPVPPSL